MAKTRYWTRLVLAIGMAGALSGCSFMEQLNREWNALLIVVQGGSSPLARDKKSNKSKPKPSVRPSVDPLDEEEREEARVIQAHQELLYEIYTTVLLRNPDEKEFHAFVGALNQGASLEGLYNGFTHSSDFRKLEIVNGPAEPGIVKTFSEVLSGLESELPVPTVFDSASAKPLIVLEPNSLATQAAPLPEPSASVVPQAQEYEKVFEKASVFTLKRILGDEALKVIASKRKDPQKLASWYSKWVLKMAERKVDFGLALRNKADEQFHYMWAMRAPEDRLKWEVLNRVHRVLKPLK